MTDDSDGNGDGRLYVLPSPEPEPAIDRAAERRVTLPILRETLAFLRRQITRLDEEGGDPFYTSTLRIWVTHLSRTVSTMERR